MLITQANKIAELEAMASQVARCRSDFEAKRDAVIALRAEIATQRKAAEAAETEAFNMRQGAKGLLRQLAGQVSKPFRDFKSKERAAYTLAEDFRELVAELENNLSEQEDDASELLDRWRNASNALRGAYADALIAEGLAALPDALIAGLRLKAAYHGSESRWATWRQFSFATSDEFALAQLHGKLPSALNREISVPDSAVLTQLQALDAAGITTGSVAARVKRREARAAAQMNTHPTANVGA
ncbi:hypothetical protein [Chitinimonas sp. JJ19]|uniref:hypothetical protein n=1 Tax=Chitinimonas sp. JJ19 TaxID=3109352 RepID=UPI00300325CD